MRALNKKRSLALLVLGALVPWIASCSDGRQSGTATDTENTLAGVVVDSTGAPLEGAAVKIITDTLGMRYGSNPILSKALASATANTELLTYTDAQGAFGFRTLPEGNFDLYVSLEAQDGSTEGVRHFRQLNSDNIPSAELEQITLTRPAILQGRVSFQRNDVPLYEFGDHFRVGILGTGRFLSTVDGREFRIEGLPPGPQTLVYYPADQFLLDKLIRAGMHRDSLIRTQAVDLSSGELQQLQPLRYRIPPEYYWARPDTAVARRNLLAGRVKFGSALVQGAQVRIIQDFQGLSYSNPGRLPFPQSDSTYTLTDSLGNFSLPVPACSSGSFNVEVLSFDGENPIGVAMHPFIDPCALQGPSHRLPDLLLLSPASVRGLLTYREDADAKVSIGSHFKVGIAGSSRYTNVTAGEIFELSGLLPGSMNLLYYPGDPFILEAYRQRGVSNRDMILSLPSLNVASGVTLQVQGVDYTLPPSMRNP